MPVFVREGCASWFETWDLRAQKTGRGAWVAHSRHGSFVPQLKAAILDDTASFPALFSALHQPDEAFLGTGETLQRALGFGKWTDSGGGKEVADAFAGLTESE